MKYPSFIFVFLSTLVIAADEPNPTLRASTTGFYPVWENTGFVERGGDAYLGLNSGHIGIENRVDLGVAPILFAYRTPNIYAKALLWQSESFSLSGQVGLFHLLEGAGSSSMSPEYSSRFKNSDFVIDLLPLSVATTYSLASWLDVHQTLTGLQVFSSGPIRKDFSLSYSLVSEFLPRQRHALQFHFNDIGIWNHDNTVLGASYRYRNTWVEFRLGYFYRFRMSGTQSGPLIGLGFLL